MRALLSVFAVFALAAAAACSQEEDAAPEPVNETVLSEASESASTAAAIRERQSHYKQMGKSIKAIGDELKADEPSLQAVRLNAARIAENAPRLLTWFPAGSGAEAGVETRAKAEIWSDQGGFRRAAQRFIVVSEQFHDITQTGDLTAIRAAQKDLGAACKNCHDDFRMPEE